MARAVGAMMVRAKRTYLFMIKVSKLFPFYSSKNYLNETENMFACFSRVIETLGSFEELEKAVETFAYWLAFPKHFPSYQTSTPLSRLNK